MNLAKRFNGAEKYTKCSILIIVLFSLVVLSLASIYHVSGDGCWHIPAGKFIANNQKIPLLEPLGRDEPFWSPPLYHMIVAFVYYLFSYMGNDAANFAVKFVSPLFGIMSLIFSFLAIKKLFNSKIGFYSTVFLAFVPIFIDYSVLSYVESTLTFFVVLSVYFMLNGRFILAGISAGLSILAKYNGVFILPVLLYILYKRFGKDVFRKKAWMVIIVPLLVAMPWFIRNWILLGNPVWPFLNFIFNGFEAKSYSALEFGRLFHYNILAYTYFGIFGVPDGNYALLALLQAPYSNILLAAWLIGTLIFIAPLIVGIFSKRNGILGIWILSYLALFFLYVMNVGWAVSRMMLPAFPAVAAFWAFGAERLFKLKKFKKMLLVLLAVVIVGFVSASYIKFGIAASQWNFYKEDFGWVKSNTKPNDIFIAHGQCVPYNIERTSLYANEENLDKADYLWVNRNFALDRVSILDDKALNLVQGRKYELAYSNKKTGTWIYKIDTK